MASDSHLLRLQEGAPAWNEWRRSEPLTRPELEGLSLTLGQRQWGETNGGPINLSRALLNNADLRHATLNGADLSGASLIGADLSGARLQGADLRNADCSRAYLDGVDFSGARLEGAKLHGANLSDARNLTEKQIEGTKRDRRTRLPRKLAAPQPAPEPTPEPTADSGPDSTGDAAPAPSLEDVVPKAHPKLGEDASPSATRATLQAMARAGAETAAAVAAVKSMQAKPPAAFGHGRKSRRRDTKSDGAWFDRVPEPVLLLAFSIGAILLLFGVERLLSLYAGNDVTTTKPPAVVISTPHQRPRGELLDPPTETASVPERDAASKQPKVATDREGRMTFSVGADDVQHPPGKPVAVAPPRSDKLGGAVESKKTSDRRPRQLAAKTPEPPPATAQPNDQPSSFAGSLSAPEKSSQWIEVFVRDVYLSGVRLDKGEIRRFYSTKVDYFGERQVSLAKVAREKAQYYRSWPDRHYDLVPDSLSIDWKSDRVADVTFLYDFEVSSPQKQTRGRGRARLTLDLGGASGLIVREDGEVIRDE